MSIGQLSQAIMAIVLGRPNDARARPSSLLKNDDDYQAVFNSEYPVDLYRICASLSKKIERFIKSDAAGVESRDRNNVKFHLAMHVSMRLAGKVSPTVQDVVQVDIDKVDVAFMTESLKDVLEEYHRLGGTDQVAKGTEFPEALGSKMSSELGGG